MSMRHQKTISEKTNESTLNTKIKNTCDCESENTTNNCVINGAWIQHKPTPALAPNHEKCVNKQTPEECKPFNSNVVTNLSPIVNNNIHESFHQTTDKTLQNENYSCDANNTHDHISNKNIASLNDLETVSCIHTLLGKMKSCKIDVSPKKVIYKKHRVIYYIVDLYRKIRLFVNMGSIIIFIFAILSVIFCMASCYTRLSTLSLRLENIDMTIDKEISLQIKINASAIYNISMQVSSFSISIISNETKNRILKIKAKEVDIHILNNGCLITLNFKGLLNKKTCLLNTIKEIQKSGFIISLKFNVHFNNFFGLKSNIHATKTINCPPKTDNNGGINIVHILKGEPVYFGATHIYNKTNITDLLFFSANMEHDDSINSEIFPINWPNFERFSILITNLEICYTGDNKKDKKIFFEYLRIKNGKLLSFKTDCHSENPICTQARIAATYISNKNITFKKIAINGVSILLDPWTINTTNKTENSETYDYKIQVNHFAFEYIDISYKQTNIRDSVIESFIKSKPQGAKGAVFLTSRTGKPLLIGNLSLIIVYRKEMLLRLHLTNIKWQVFINAIKVRGIVQITIEGSDKFVWFACLRSLKFSETINELYKKTDKSVDQCGILLETRSASNEQSDRINNYLNLKVPKKSKFYKSKVQIDIGETKVQLTNDLFSIYFSSQKTTIKKMRNSSRLEKDFQFDLQIKPHDKHMLLRDHSIEKFMFFKTENGQEINLTELSRGVCGIKEAVTLTNIIELKAVKDQVCSVTIKTTEKLSGCINWKIKFPDQYALFSKNEKLKIINFSPIDIYVEGGKVLFNDVSFSLKFDDILTDLLFQQWQFLDFNCTTSTDYAISLLINFMFMRNNKKDSEKTVCDNSSNKTIATSKTIHELFSESGLSSTELDLFNKEQLNSQIKNSLTVVNDSRNDLKTQINKIDSELDSIISEYTSNAISIIKLKIDVADEYETLYFSLTFNKPISAREIIEKCKYNFLNLNFHSYFSEGNADAEIHEELNEITKKIMKILNFPFNQTKINFESIELNMKENDKETNVFKILFSKNIFTGKSQQIKIKVEIKLIHLLKLFETDDAKFEVVLRKSGGQKFIFFKPTKSRSLLYFLKKTLNAVPAPRVHKYSPKRYFIFKTGQESEGVFLGRDFLSDNIEQLYYFSQNILFINLLYTQYQISLVLPYGNALIIHVSDEKLDDVIKIEILKSNFHVLISNLIVKYMFYQEENDSSCLKDFMFFIAELVPIAYKAVCSGISNMFNFVKNTLTKSKKPRGLENPETEEITKLKNAGPSQSPARRCGLIRMLYTYCFKYWKNQKPKTEPERLGTYSKTIHHLSQRITVSGTGDPFCLSLNLNFYDIETQINDCFEVWRFVYDGVCLRQTLQLKKGTRELVGLNIVLQYLTECESSQKSKLDDDTEVYKYLIDNYKRAKKYLEANLNIREFNFDSIYIADLIQ